MHVETDDQRNGSNMGQIVSFSLGSSSAVQMKTMSLSLSPFPFAGQSLGPLS